MGWCVKGNSATNLFFSFVYLVRWRLTLHSGSFPLAERRLEVLIPAANEQQRAQPARGEQRERGWFGHDGQIHRQGGVKHGFYRLIRAGVEVGKVNRNDGGLDR